MNRRKQYADDNKARVTGAKQKRRWRARTGSFTGPRLGQKWNEIENRLVLDHAVPDRELAQQIGRSVQAISAQRGKVVAKAKPIKLNVPSKTPSPIAIGIDLSLSSLALSAKMYDGTLAKMIGPAWSLTRWEKGFLHDDKLAQVAKAHDFIHKVMCELNGGIIHSVEHLYIGVEELPPRQMNAQRYREQSEIIGSFVGGLKRYGFTNIYRVNIKKWQALVASDLEKTKIDKWNVKNWVIEVYGAPKWKDLIYNSKQGLIPKPKGSKAMPIQPDDRYDATGIMDWIWENYASKAFNR